MIEMLLPEQGGKELGWFLSGAGGLAVKRSVCYRASPHFTLFVIKVVSAFPS